MLTGDKTANNNSFQVPDVLATALAGGKNYFVQTGSQLIDIVDSSDNLAQANAKVNSMNVSESQKQLFRKQLEEYYNN